MLSPQMQRVVARLRSGKVIQLRGALGKPDGRRCCLGVMCDIAVEDGIIEAPTVDAFEENYRYGESTAFLPEAVRKYFNLQDIAGRFVPQEGSNCLASLSGNNDTGVSFSEIANIIESEPYGLFEKK